MKALKIALFGRCLRSEDINGLRSFWKELKEFQAKGLVEIEVYEHLMDLLIENKLAEPSDKVSCFTDKLSPDSNLLLSLGGDGTLLDTLPLVRDSGVKVMGINLGTLGFLSGADREELELLPVALQKGLYLEEKRSVLQVDTKVGSTPIEFPYALNEVVLFKKDNSSLISVYVTVNGKLLNRYYGDGVIFATATGSTAYSLSCGGPIMFPEMNALLITPVASHTLTVRPILLPAGEEVEVEVEGNIDFKLSLDSEIYTLQGPCKFGIKKAPFDLHTIRLTQHDFVSTLRQKLMWGIDGRRR